VREGRWQVAGAMWIEPDANLPSGESLIRQLQHGLRWYRDHFGEDAPQRMLFLPDTFGFPACLPQLARLAGLDTFVTNKLAWNDTNEFPFTTFRWRGLDGTAILAHCTPGHEYNATMTPAELCVGEDVGGRYGNAFLLLRPLLEAYGDRILNSPLAEGAVLGGCIGAALAGARPIAEMQFNDFVATGFNQLVNNAAKIRYRWGASVPMVVRMPWGGLRHAGPYHSQNTEPWFYRVPGLKIAVPSTPHDARAMMAAAVADPDPVMYYEHIGLYRDPRIKQALGHDAPAPLPVGRAALRRAGDDLAIVSYGAYVHAALRVADALAADGIEASVLDLRWLSPLDKAALLAVARRTGRVLVVHEDSRTGGIGESLAAIVQEEAFEWLDAPVRVIGALDTPVPYAPPLEAAFLPGEGLIERAARLLTAY
jgi:2-oxoisovalerate dehydrogenase E1 component beta subunit